MFLRKTLIGLLAIFALCASSELTHANGGSARVTKYLVDRLAFDLATQQTEQIGLKEFGTRLSQSRKLISKLPPEQLRDINSRISKIQERFHETWKRPSREKSPDLMPAEKAWLDEMIARELRISPKWRTGSPDAIDFLHPTPEAGNFRSARDEFLHRSSRPALVDQGKQVAARARPKAVARFKKYINELEGCRTNPINSQRMSDFGSKYIFTQLLVDEAMTLGGAMAYSLVSSGEIDNVDWKMLPQELAFEAMTSVTDSFVASRGGSFRVRWFKMQAVGFGQSGVDVTLYYFNSNSGAPGESKRRDSLDRGGYDTAWNVASGAVSIKLFDLIAGLECVGVRGSIVLGAQIATGLGVNMAYFGLRAATKSDAH